jgi:hypothetical protein
MTTLRLNGAPASSLVGYALEGDELLVAADAGSLKVRCIENDRRLTLCVFGTEAPPRFATIEGRGRVERQHLEGPKQRVLRDALPQGNAASVIEAWLTRPQTLVVRVRATRVWGVLTPAA